MASYVPKSFCNTNASVTNTNLFTVPAGHKYIIDQALALFAFGVGGPFAITLELSDTAGTNFRRITPTNSENVAGAGSIVVDWTSPFFSTPGTTVDNGASVIRNLVMEAGQ